MKKNFGLLILLLFLIFSSIRIVKAYQLKETFTEYYFYRRGGGKKPMSGELNSYEINGNTTYCIEPGVYITEGANYVEEGQSPLSQELTNKLSLIAYYGYDYPTHHTLNYRMATQLMIWEVIGGQQNEIWTEISGGGTYIPLTDERNEINNLISKHDIKPSFHRHLLLVKNMLLLIIIMLLMIILSSIKVILMPVLKIIKFMLNLMNQLILQSI